MKTEIQVLEKLKETIASHLNQYLENQDGVILDAINEQNIEIDFPDTDNMKKNTMFYIQPDGETLEDLSLSSDLATMDATIFIMCKGAKNAILIKKVFGYYSALYRLLRSYQTLDGFIEGLRNSEIEYYPALTASLSMTAIEVHITMQWSKEL